MCLFRLGFPMAKSEKEFILKYHMPPHCKSPNSITYTRKVVHFFFFLQMGFAWLKLQDRRTQWWLKETDAAVQTRWEKKKSSHTYGCDSKHSSNPLGDYKSTYTRSAWLFQIPRLSRSHSTLLNCDYVGKTNQSMRIKQVTSGALFKNHCQYSWQFLKSQMRKYSNLVLSFARTWKVKKKKKRILLNKKKQCVIFETVMILHRNQITGKSQSQLSVNQILFANKPNGFESGDRFLLNSNHVYRHS